jgi:peptidoglycan/xylan/chitin deacetylase (PgdA/CDA1 family)
MRGVTSPKESALNQGIDGLIQCRARSAGAPERAEESRAAGGKWGRGVRGAQSRLAPPGHEIRQSLAGPRRKLTQLWARLTDRSLVKCEFERPVVSFTFDDFPRSALESGGRMLEEAGARGTYYVSFGLANKDTEVGPIGSLDDLAAPEMRGHELGCHSYDHFDSEYVSTNEMAHSLDRNQEVAMSLGLRRARDFSYPFGHFSRGIKVSAMTRYGSARTTVCKVNRGVTDLGLLSSIPLGFRVGRERLDAYFREVEESRGWMILYTHDVTRRPSKFGITPEDFRWAMRRALQISADIQPVENVIERLKDRKTQA